MSEVAVESLNLSKKFKKGEMFDSLRDLIPAMVGRSVKAAGSGSLKEQGAEPPSPRR